jgi:prepilin-type N-terminal cleavage/methylation domain-containing protein
MPKNGFSLVEILVVLGLLGGLAVFMMNLSQQGTKVNKQTKSENEINSWQREISSYFTDANACKKSMLESSAGAITDDLPPPATPVNITKIYKKTCTSTDIDPAQYNDCTQEAYSVGLNREGVTLASMSFQDYQPNNTAKLVLNFNYNLGPGQQMSKTRIIPLNITTISDPSPDNDFRSCSSSASNIEINPLEVCNIALGFEINTPAGNNPGENPYFESGKCHFKFASRKEACLGQGGKFIKPLRHGNFNRNSVQTYDTACQLSDFSTSDEDICYCKTKWSTKIDLLNDWHPTLQGYLFDLPMQVNRNVGPPFVIPDFPADVGVAINTAPTPLTFLDKRRRIVKIKGMALVNYKIPFPNMGSSPFAQQNRVFSDNANSNDFSFNLSGTPVLNNIDTTYAGEYPAKRNPYDSASPTDFGAWLWETPYLPSVQLDLDVFCHSVAYPAPALWPVTDFNQYLNTSATGNAFVPGSLGADSFTYTLTYTNHNPTIYRKSEPARVYGSAFSIDHTTIAPPGEPDWINASTKFPAPTITTRGLYGGLNWINLKMLSVEKEIQLAPGDRCYLSITNFGMFPPTKVTYLQSGEENFGWRYTDGSGSWEYLTYESATIAIKNAHVIIEQDSNRSHQTPNNP